MTIHHATGVSSVTPSLFDLSGRYKFRGFPDWEPNHPRYRGLRSTVPDLEPDEEEAEHPSVIVARLREKIAARSPAHAALVAAFLALPEPPPEGGLWEQAVPILPVSTARPSPRKLRYLALRSAGVASAEAAARTGVPSRTRTTYEAQLRNPPCLCGDKAHRGRPCARRWCGCAEYRPAGAEGSP